MCYNLALFTKKERKKEEKKKEKRRSRNVCPPPSFFFFKTKIFFHYVNDLDMECVSDNLFLERERERQRKRQAEKDKRRDRGGIENRSIYQTHALGITKEKRC